MSRNWKKYLLVAVDLMLVAYLACAITVFNKPDETMRVCVKAHFTVADQSSDGFIDTAEITRRLKNHGLYPLGKQMGTINSRRIEEVLKSTPFVKTAECYKTDDGQVYVSITQMMPVLRVKADNGDDYYIDDKDCIMPNSAYTSDLVIATGRISRRYARMYLSPMARAIMRDDTWKNLVEQINVLPDLSVEIVPRVGNHIVCLGQLPEAASRDVRSAGVQAFTQRKLERLMKFYRFGLSQVGWDKYSYINLELDNQIVCKRRDYTPAPPAAAVAAPPPAAPQPATPPPAAPERKAGTGGTASVKKRDAAAARQETPRAGKDKDLRKNDKKDSPVKKKDTARRSA